LNTFLDTNIVVYAHDAADPRKQRIAADLLHTHALDRTGVLSTQVLAEYAAVAVEKLRQDPDLVTRQLLLLERMTVVQVTGALTRRAIEIRRTYGLRIWDAAILAAAEHAGCDVLLSEDLNPGQLYSGIRAQNPFA
jgi:predicted nucleic acid-binding protein